MPNLLNPDDPMKSSFYFSASSTPIHVKLDRMLQSIARVFQSDRCLLLRPEKIVQNGFLSGMASDRKPLWVEEGLSFLKENVLPEEKDLLCPSFACIPLYDEITFQGILYVGFSKSHRFSPQEVDLLLLMGEAIGAAIAHEKRVRELSTLWELNKALLTTVNFDRVLHLALTAITIGEGLKFNRAILFLINEKDHLLEGTMAVGPDNAEEAGRVWSSLSQRKGSLLDTITQLYPQGHSALNSIVNKIQIPLEQEQCILSRTALEGRPFNIQFPQSEEGGYQSRCERGCHLGSEVGCYVGEHLSRNPRVYAFATVPLMGKGKVIGVILVDNLYDQKPITEEDIHSLTMFANQAGLAIENAILYRNLEEFHQELKETQAFLVHLEKMVALGEMSTTIAHELKNPLTSIGGFARRLDRAIPDESQEKKYTQTIMKEVSRLEKILNGLLNYTQEQSPDFKELDLRDILEESLSMVTEGIRKGGIELIKEYGKEIPKIMGDSHQIKQTFFNLIDNACQAMKEKGTLFLRVHPFSKNGSSYIRVEVQDTGKGIDPENLHNIFNPFYSTKESSLGLGLPMVHKIITSHNGQIEVDNRPGKGVNFITILPAIPTEGRSEEKPTDGKDVT
jgi:signal transduction histidine kinase